MAEGEQRNSSSQEAYVGCTVDHHALVNKESAYPDVYFHVDEKNILMAHYYVLKMRVPQLIEEGPALDRKKTTGKGNKKDAKVVIKLKKTELITPGALERVLIWAYCGVIDYSDFTPFKAIEVMRACTVYKLQRLMQMCEKYLSENLSMKNIFALLKFADSLNVQEAKDICFDFALANSDFFTSSSAENLGFKLYQEVTALLLKAHQSANKGKPPVREVTAEDTIVSDFKNLYGSADVTGDISFIIHNEEIKAHRAILSHQSAALNELVAAPEDGREPAKKGITLDTKYARISPGSFHAMLKFFYYSESSISMLHATELVGFAKDFHLERLYKLLEKVIGGQEITVDTVLNVLDVAYHPLMEENPALQKNLKEEGLSFAVNNVDKINFDTLQNMPPIIATHILQALQHRIGKNWKLILDSSGEKNVRIDELKAAPSGASASPRKEKTASSAPAESVQKSPSKATIDPKKREGSKDVKAAEKKEEKKEEKAKEDKAKEEKKDEKKHEGEKKHEEKKAEEKKAEDAKISRSKSKKHDEKGQEVATPKGKDNK